MVVVAAFGTLANTTHAGLTAYFRAAGCTTLTIADVIPILSKITVYEQEYVIGEIKIYDTGSISDEPNNCVMVRVMVYNDGWIVAWFDKESQNQEATGATTFVDAQTLGGFGSLSTEYSDKWNGCQLKVTSSSPTDSECPDDTVFYIRNVDSNLNQIQVHANIGENYYTLGYHFNTGHTYTVEIYQDNGNLVWWGHNSNTHSPLPPNMSNRLYRAIYEMWEVLVDNSNTTSESLNSVTKAFLDDGGVFTDYTTEINNTGTADFYFLPSTEQVNDAFYYGHSDIFSEIIVNIYTAGVGNTIVWEYWDGVAWVTLTVTDNTSGYTISGTNDCTWTPPGDWAKTTVNFEEYYWVRSRCSVAAYTTRPRGTQGWLMRKPYHLDYEDTNLGMYSFEDTSANYCLLCGINEYTAYVAEDDVYFYNTSLPGKTIYKHSISCGSYIVGSSGIYVYFYVNDKSLLLTNASSSSIIQRTNGYIIFNIKTIAGTTSIQNVFRCHGKSDSIYEYSYGNMASVLITS